MTELASLACSGNDGDGSNPGADGSSNTQQSGSGQAPLYEQLACDLPTALEYCGGGTCHYDNASPDVASGLPLWDRQAGTPMANLETLLVGVPASYRNVTDPDTCPTQPELLIDPSSVEQSLLLKKLAGTHACGDEMPKFPYPEWGTVANPGPQREAFIACLRDWVTLLAEARAH